MPLWLLFTLSFFVFALTTAASVHYFVVVVLASLATGEAYAFAAAQAYGLALLAALIIGLLFFTLARLTAFPMRKLTEAVDAFAERGERIPVVIPSFAPKEIHRLMRSFVGLLQGVEATHKRDTEVSRVKSDFISTAAHQFRTPLTGIRWALEALGNGELTEEQRALVKNATDKSHELVGIVGTLLDISAIESGKYQYKLAPVDIGQLAAEVVADFKVPAESRTISLSYIPGENLPLVRADRERVKWVLNNLIENAIRYTPASGAVRVTASSTDERVTVAVRDTGIGIPGTDRANIFERFYRAKNAIAKENEGNGLGLYIARTIANDHGGDLNFASNTEGPGTTFTLSLPIGS